jgi:glycine dehydrogenase
MAWPLVNSLMIEITETETKEEIERFHQAMAQIRHEIDAVRAGQYAVGNNPLTNAPHTQYDLLNWEHPYSIEVGCFPVPGQYKGKFWPMCNRVDDAYGDRNFPECQAGISIEKTKQLDEEQVNKLTETDETEEIEKVYA